MNVLSVSSALTVRIGASAPTPRGVEGAPALGNRLARFGRSVWAGLERAGYRRAQRHMDLLGLQYPLLTERTEALRAVMERDIVARESRDTDIADRHAANPEASRVRGIAAPTATWT